MKMISGLEKGRDEFCSAILQVQQGTRAGVIASVDLGDAMHGNRIEGWDSCLGNEGAFGC